MLAHCGLNLLSINTCKWETFLTFMLEYSGSNMVYIYKQSIELSKYLSNRQHSMLDFRKGKTSSWNYNFQLILPNIHVSNFGHSLRFGGLMYRWKIYPTLYVIFSDIQLNNTLMKISNIYVRITGYLLRLINIHCCKNNS